MQKTRLAGTAFGEVQVCHVLPSNADGEVDISFGLRVLCFHFDVVAYREVKFREPLASPRPRRISSAPLDESRQSPTITW